MNTSPEAQCRAFATNLTRLRRDRGLSQARLARDLSVKAPFLSAIEHLRKPPPHERMASRISDVLRMPEREAASFTESARRARVAWKEWLDQKKGRLPQHAHLAGACAAGEAGLLSGHVSLVIPLIQSGEFLVELSTPSGVEQVTVQVRRLDVGTTERRPRM